MIRIFDEMQSGDETDAFVSGGLLVTAENRSDVEKLLRRCLSLRTEERQLLDSTRLREPMRALYADLLAGGTDENTIDVTSELTGVSSLAANGAKDALDNLILALGMIVDEWENEPISSIEDLRLFMAIANPTTTASDGVELGFSTPTPLLALQSGSVIATFMVERSLKAQGWVVAIGAKTARLLGRTPQAAGDRLVQGARENAGKKCKHVLLRLDELNENNRLALCERQLVIVFLHGLFATDLGTFDDFIDQLYTTDPRELLSKAPLNGSSSSLLGGRGELLAEVKAKLHASVEACSAKLQEKNVLPRTPEEAVKFAVGLVGWPHNTLTAISTNAGMLTELIENTFLPEPPRIMFVCHSRGGLVGRATIANLLGTGRRETWRKALAGLITFGTPHDGAGIAEHDLRDHAAYFLLMQSTGKVTSLLDVLTYLESRTPEGIEQLKSFEATTEVRSRAYIDQLYADERNLVKDSTGRRMPPVMAVGGTLDQGQLSGWKSKAASALVTRWLSTHDHDMVVERKSSLSKRLGADITAEMKSDHFSYFERLGTAPEIATTALGCIWAELDLAKAFVIPLSKRLVMKAHNPET